MNNRFEQTPKSVAPKKSKKSRVVEIETHDTNVPPAPDLVKQQKELTHQMREQIKIAGDLIGQHDKKVFGPEVLQDALIRQQLDKLSTSRAKAVALIEARATLLMEYKLIRFNFDVYKDKQVLDPTDATKAAKLLTFFEPSLQITPDKVLTYLAKHVKKALEKHREIDPYRMTETLIRNDTRDLPALKTYVEEMRQINDLITARLAELEQKKEKPSVLQRRLIDLNEEIRLKQKFIKLSYQIPEFLKDVHNINLFVTRDSIYREMASVIADREQDVARLTHPDAYVEIPLESQRLAENISSAEKTLKALDSIGTRLSKNHLEINKTVDEAAQNSRNYLIRKAQASLIKIEDIKKIADYGRAFGDQLAKAENSIKEFIHGLSDKPTQESLTVIAVKQLREARKIESYMHPIWELLHTTNVAVFEKTLTELNVRLSELKRAKQGTLEHIEQFRVDPTIEEELQQLQIDPKNFIADVTYIHELKGVIKKIEKQEQDALSLLRHIRNREGSTEVIILNKMMASIDGEMASIRGPDDNEPILTDPRLPILQNIKLGLQDNLDDYLQLRTTKDRFVADSITVIKNQCTDKILASLTDTVAGGFIRFIRTLLEPINQLLKQFNGTTYSSGFFSKSAEKNVATAAQTAHSELTALQQRLNDAESEIGETQNNQPR